jgi:hypothetical protein
MLALRIPCRITTVKTQQSLWQGFAKFRNSGGSRVVEASRTKIFFAHACNSILFLQIEALAGRTSTVVPQGNTGRDYGAIVREKRRKARNFLGQAGLFRAAGWAGPKVIFGAAVSMRNVAPKICEKSVASSRATAIFRAPFPRLGRRELENH